LTKTWTDLTGSFTVAGDRMTGPFTGLTCAGRITLTRR